MAGRPKKTVEYFPHMLKESTTIKALEMLYGNNGYAVWFKLLEVLGSSTDYKYIAKSKDQCNKLLDKFRIDGKLMSEILNTLCELNAIDKDLWRNERILYVPNLLNNIQKVKQKVNSNTNLVEKDKDATGKSKYAEYVFLTDEEYNKLINKYGENAIQEKIDALNIWIGEKPSDKKRQKSSHYYTILKWFQLDEKRNIQNPNHQQKKPQYRDLSNYSLD